MNYSIKKATINDLEFLQSVENQCFDDPWNFDMLDSELRSSNTTYSIFFVNDIPVGYYAFLHIFDEAHILNIAILPQFQGKGYANKMMELLLEQTMNFGLVNITLEVRKSNQRAINLYKKHGFTFVGARPKYYMNGEDALIFWLYR